MSPKLAEIIGTFFLVLAGSGAAQMGLILAPESPAIGLIGGTIAVGAVLYVFITLFAPVSGAHFNPAVSLTFALRGELGWGKFGGFVMAQLLGAALASFAVHLMFELPLWQPAANMTPDLGQLFSELLATSGLILVILLAVNQRSAHIPALVALYVAAGYWMTSSSIVANPAVTFARMFT